MPRKQIRVQVVIDDSDSDVFVALEKLSGTHPRLAALILAELSRQAISFDVLVRDEPT